MLWSAEKKRETYLAWIPAHAGRSGRLSSLRVSQTMLSLVSSPWTFTISTKKKKNNATNNCLFDISNKNKFISKTL